MLSQPKSEGSIPNQCNKGDIIEPDYVFNKTSPCNSKDSVIQTSFHLESGSQGHPSSNPAWTSSSSECVSESSVKVEGKDLPNFKPTIRVIDETSPQFYYKRMTKLEMLASFFLPVALIREIRFNQKAKKAAKAQKKEASSNNSKEISVQSKALFSVKLPFSKHVNTGTPLKETSFVNVDKESKSWMKTRKLKVKVPKKLKFNRSAFVLKSATQQDTVDQKPKKHSKSKKQKSKPEKSDTASLLAPSLQTAKPYFRIFVESFETKAKASMYVEPWCPVANVVQAAHVKMGDYGQHDEKEYLLIKGLLMRNLTLEQYGVQENDVLCVIRLSSLQLINASMAEAEIVQPQKKEFETVKELEKPEEQEGVKEMYLEQEVKSEEPETLKEPEKPEKQEGVKEMYMEQEVKSEEPETLKEPEKPEKQEGVKEMYLEQEVKSEEPETLKEPEKPEKQEGVKEMYMEQEVNSEEPEKSVEFNSYTYAYETNGTIKVFC